jgi:hypothetical protein
VHYSKKHSLIPARTFAVATEASIKPITRLMMLAPLLPIRLWIKRAPGRRTRTTTNTASITLAHMQGQGCREKKRLLSQQASFGDSPGLPYF